MKVIELDGALLDLWVARAERKCYTQSPGVWGNAVINDLGRLSISKNSWDCARYFEPSKNWGHGGPIIEREKIALFFDDHDDPWSCWLAHLDEMPTIAGRTALIAAMRAYVVSKFGDEVPSV